MRLVLLFLTLSTLSADERIVVTFRSASLNTGIAVPENVTIVKQYGRRLVLSISDETDPATIAEALGGERAVERIEADTLVGTESNSSSMAAPPWHLDPLEPYGLHLTAALTSKPLSVVALIDSGLAASASNLWRPVAGFCFISSSQYTNTKVGRNPDFIDPGDQGPTCPTPSWHGTKAASIVKAVAPNSKLSILRVLGRCGAGFASDVTDAIVWAAGGGINGVSANPYPARVVSMSLAGRGPCPSYMQSAVNQAIQLGATLIAAAGNAGANATLYFPGNCNGVLSIGASTRQGTMAAYSNWGQTVALSAPGGDAANPVQVMTVGDSGSMVVGYATGTSFAAPHVAGVVLMLQAEEMNLATGGQFIPFAQCTVCGKILSGPADTVQASQTCAGSLTDTAWTTQAGYMRSSGDTDSFFYCNDPCFVTNIRVCDKGGGMRSIRVQCSDGNYSPTFGYQGACDGTYGSPATSALGFTGIKTYAGGDINGVEIQQISGATTSYGCTGCQTTYNLQCGTAPDSRRRTIFGVQSAYNADFIHSLKFLCGARRCAFGFWYNTGANDCVDCNRCGAGSYADGCSGSSAGTCRSCVTCSSTQYQSGCGGVNPGGCFACGQCSAGSSYSGCGQCTPCSTGTYVATTGYSTSCTQCAPGTFATSTGSTACAACTVCSDGYYETLACTHTQNRQCGLCLSCPTNQYRSGCTLSSSGACSNCPVCPAGQYTTGCSGRQQGNCATCPPSNSCAGELYSQPVPWKVTSCPAGSYLSTNPSALSDGKCTLCSSTYYCPAGSTALNRCPAGSYCSLNGITKTQCPAGSYCPEGSTAHITCGPGSYSSSSAATSSSVCTQCSAGHFAGAAGSTACALCSAGSVSGGAGFSRCTDCVDTVTYQSLQGQSVCNPCTKDTCPAGTSTQTCSKTTDRMCLPCPAIANCKYGSNLCTDPASKRPACACSKGYQMVGQACVQCPHGTFKAVESSAPCAPWTSRTCPAPALGTRESDSACVPFPAPPDNAVESEWGGWRCNAGYEIYRQY